MDINADPHCSRVTDPDMAPHCISGLDDNTQIGLAPVIAWTLDVNTVTGCGLDPGYCVASSGILGRWLW